VTGVLGPNANAHGPNEFLHIDFSRRLTCCVASVLASHCRSKVDAQLRQEASSEGSGGAKEVAVDCSDMVVPADSTNAR